MGQLPWVEHLYADVVCASSSPSSSPFRQKLVENKIIAGILAGLSKALPSYVCKSVTETTRTRLRALSELQPECS